jgi:hypothetical protein
MKRVFMTLILVTIFIIPTGLVAQPIICQVGAFYSDRIELSNGVPQGFMSGHKVLVFMRTMPGIDESQIRDVTFVHVTNDGKENAYRPAVWCGQSWPTIIGPCGGPAERMWLLPLAFAGRTLGEWYINVRDIFGRVERRRFFVDYYNYPLPPQNFFFWTDPGTDERFLEWDASVGPPEFVRDPSSPYRGRYRVTLTPPGFCAMQEVLQTSDMDVSMWWFNATSNRIGVRLPAHWVGNNVRVSNIIRDGGFIGWPAVGEGPDNYFGQGGWSRGTTRITLE